MVAAESTVVAFATLELNHEIHFFECGLNGVWSTMYDGSYRRGYSLSGAINALLYAIKNESPIAGMNGMRALLRRQRRRILHDDFLLVVDWQDGTTSRFLTMEELIEFEIREYQKQGA